MTFARRPLAEAVFWSVPVVLFLPALYYSLTTPFGLVDDYWSSTYASFFDLFGRFDPASWSAALESADHPARYRPFWVFYQAATWTVFGPVPWLHHLARWLTVTGAVFAFSAAFSAFPSAAPAGRGAAAGFVRLLPRALLVHLWVFFPNQPAARLGPQEVSTVFFMGLCTWMTARMLVRRDRADGKERGSTPMTHALFVLGCFGLVWSKEVNIAVALWMLVFYCAPLLKRMDRTRIIGGLALAAVVVHTAWTVSGLWEAGGYGTASLTPQLVIDNARWLATGLFQVDTSPVIAAGLAVLAALLPVFVGRANRRERLFVLFLLGQFASLYLIFCLSYSQAPRYWYPLVPVFATLVAFSAKFMLGFVAPPTDVSVRPASRPLRARFPIACALAGFVLFFIGCNYANTLLQTVVQHRARHTEKALLAEVTRLLDRGRHVQVMDFAEGDELMQNILVYYNWFLPRFEGRHYDIHDIWTPVVPSNHASEPRYWVAHGDGNLPLPHDAVDDYPLLSRARDVAAILQSDTPHWTYDSGALMRRWYVASTDPDYGSDGVMQVGPEGPHEPAGDLDLDARLDNSISRYIRERAVAGALFSNDFSSVSHIHGHDSALEIHDGLPCVEGFRSRKLPPYDVHIAWFRPGGGVGGSVPDCVDVARLHLEIEQEGGLTRAESGVVGPMPTVARGTTEVVDLWESPMLELAAELDDGFIFKVTKSGVSPFQAQYEAAAAGEPVVDGVFDVYLRDGQLTYVKGDGCTAELTRAPFFLHVGPVSMDALVPSRREHGFDAFSFDFHQRGKASEGRCFMTVPLPGYAVSGIRTGQSAADGEIVWSGTAFLGNER